MERSRTEQHRIKKRHRKNRSLLALSAAAAVCASGVWIWVQGSGSKHAAEGAGEAVPTASAAQASAAGRLSPVQTVSPSPAAASDKPSEAAASLTPQAKTASAPIQPEAGGSRLRMAFVGDVLFGSTVETLLKRYGYDYPYRELLNELSEPDLTAANLETPITIRGDAQKKEYTYRSRPEALKPFQEAGFDVVNLANNHIMDYGVNGLLDTLSSLDQAGILRTGAGKDADEAYKPAVIEKNGIKTAFLGFSHKIPEKSWKADTKKPGTTQLYDPRTAVEAVAKADKEADIVVVMTHWGEEREDKPLQVHRDLAKKFIDAGADLIIGSHPHVLQGFEQYKGKWIVYSLGNFLFTTNAAALTWESVVLEAECSKEAACQLSAVPVWNKFAQPVKMGDEDGRKLFERLSGISFGASVDREGKISSIGP